MKKITSLFLLVFTLTAFINIPEQEFSIVGTWEGIDDEEVGYFIFQEDGYAFIQRNGEKFGGKDFDIEGKKGSMYYEIDYSKDPMEIDIVMEFSDNSAQKRLLFIVKKITNDKIHMAVGFSGERPTTFKENEELIFTRVQK